MTSYSDKLKDPRWQKKRLKILERDGFRCKECDNSENTLHVHHLYYDESEPWEYPDSSLVTLCEDCHATEGASMTEMRKALRKSLGQAGYDSYDILDIVRLIDLLIFPATNKQVARAALVSLTDSYTSKTLIDRYFTLADERGSKAFVQERNEWRAARDAED